MLSMIVANEFWNQNLISRSVSIPCRSSCQSSALSPTKPHLMAEHIVNNDGGKVSSQLRKLPPSVPSQDAFP